MVNYAVQFVNDILEKEKILEQKIANGEEDISGMLDPYFVRGLPGIELEEIERAKVFDTDDKVDINQNQVTDWNNVAVVNEDDL